MKPQGPEYRLQLPPKLLPLFAPPRGALRYRATYGGRGSAKSRSVATMAAAWGYAEKLRILCVREFQKSIKESFHAELKRAIDAKPWLAAGYDVGVDYLRGRNGTEFLFMGCQNLGTIKSLSGIDLLIVEEAEDLSEESWQVLEPTIRDPRSEIWAIWNPRTRGSPVDRRFRQHPPPRCMVVELNASDNPWFPAELEEQRRHARATLDDGTYRHIWEGAYLEISAAQVYSGRYVVQAFEQGVTPGSKLWQGPYYGLDFGFAQDPTAALRCWVGDEPGQPGRPCLWIDYDASKVGLELDATAAYLSDRIPGIAQAKVRADNARPESISLLARQGLRGIVACTKGKGSVEDGIHHIRSFGKIVVHPRCVATLEELRLYSYKVDRATGDIQPEPVDAHNHLMDALRYALEPVRKSNSIDWAAAL